jgi:hypothetical protein
MAKTIDCLRDRGKTSSGGTYMRKKLLVMLLTLCITLTLTPFTASAAGAIEVSNDTQLREAITGAKTTPVIINVTENIDLIPEDIILPPYSDITLNLQGHTITGAGANGKYGLFYMKNAYFTVIGGGTINCTSNRNIFSSMVKAASCSSII